MFWQPVFRSDKLVFGRPAPLRILGEDFTLYRGKSGAAHVVGPRCPHRGVTLGVGRVIDDNIQCFYHGWTFDGSGQCVAQPAEEHGFAQRVKIPSYPTREYLGFVFAYFGEGAPPEFPMFDIFHGEGMVEMRGENFRPWPFFTQLENGVDETHFNFTHQRTKFDDLGMNAEIPKLSCEETGYGFMRLGQRGEDIRTGHFLMPNWSLSSNYEHDKGWAEHMVWRVPVDDDTHKSFAVDFVYKTGTEAETYRRMRANRIKNSSTAEPAMSMVSRILKGELHPDDVPADRVDIVMIQDAISCVGQGPNRSRDDDILGTSDIHVALLRRIWSRELRALAEGRPLTPWKIPKDLRTTRGLGDTPKQPKKRIDQDVTIPSN